MGKHLHLPANFYNQFDADLGADIPGRGYKGWTTRILDVPFERTALVSMHAWAKAVALWRVSLMFGYVFDVAPFIAALNEMTEGV